jgi:tRNA threonylcarbamoyladenosine biosynthesis protein TsaE
MDTADELKREIYINDPAETEALAQRFAGELTPGDVLAFYGNLGSGKTFFIKALCRALGVEQEATSPTFTIINEYRGKADLVIYHFDFYRLENSAELANLGLDDYFYNDYICVIEWADKIRRFLPPARWDIHIDFVPDKPQARRIQMKKVEE